MVLLQNLGKQSQQTISAKAFSGAEKPVS